MPIGGFLTAMPVWMFVMVHLVFLCVGIWAAKKAMAAKLAYANAFWLYPLVHLGFLAHFGGLFTLELSVFLEQMLMVVMVVWIAKNAK